MLKSKTVYSVAKRVVYLIATLAAVIGLSLTSFADTTFGRNNDLVDSAGVADEEVVGPTLPEVSLGDVTISKEELDAATFNGVWLDTVIYIVGGLAGFMMILQIAAMCVCKVFPSWNERLEKLSKIGITGYGNGYVLPVVKILLLGVLSYLCISGYMKFLVSGILQWFVIVINNFK